MATLKTFLLVLFFLSRQNSPSAALTCKQQFCNKSGQIIIRFPFRVNQTDQPKRCGYPNFDLACNDDGQAVLNIGSAGEFVIADVINYWDPSITIGDPQNCMANRWLNYNSTPSFAPFQISPLDYHSGYDNYTFLNCTKNITSLNLPNNTPIPCLSGDGHTVTALLPDDFAQIGHVPCAVISKSVWVPRPRFDSVFSNRVWLTWTDPDCKQCEVNGGSCSFGSDSGHDLTCSYPSRIVQHLIAAAIILCFVSCFLALVFHVCIMSRSEREHPNSGGELGAGPDPGQAGLDKVVVDSYPETVFGENKDSSGPDDNTCSICISEYQQGEVLKTIPSCKHYFHGACIDKWLLKNATCPLCRILTRE